LIDALMRLKQTDGRKVIVLLSDGRDEDNAGTGPGSARSQPELFAALGQTDATIYPIGLGPRVDRGLLERLAAESGGAAYFPEDVSKLRGDYARIVEELRRRYLVSYTSTNPRRDGGWRAVEITTRLPELNVRSRGGYAAPER
jgi:VWFA-related protein